MKNDKNLFEGNQYFEFNEMKWNLQMVALIILLMDYFVTVVEVKAVKADNMWLDSGVGQITRFTLDYKGIHKKSVHRTTKNFTKKRRKTEIILMWLFENQLIIQMVELVWRGRGSQQRWQAGRRLTLAQSPTICETEDRW